MVIIRFRDGVDWFKANWVFRQLAEDTIAAFPQDGDLQFIMMQAQALGALFLDSMDTDAASATTRAIRKVAEGTIQGTIQGWRLTRPEDGVGQQMYLKSISELLDLIRDEEDAEKGDQEK